MTIESRNPARPPYDYRNCQSLFGYAERVHARSGGVCELCGAGSDRIDFDLWRQLSVEHLIGESQGGYPRQITSALSVKFPDLSPGELQALVTRIDLANTVTACSFCNSSTSRNRAARSMTDLIGLSDDGPGATVETITASLASLLVTKRAEVVWKLVSVRAAFDERIAPIFAAARNPTGSESAP